MVKAIGVHQYKKKVAVVGGLLHFDLPATSLHLKDVTFTFAANLNQIYNAKLKNIYNSVEKLIFK